MGIPDIFCESVFQNISRRLEGWVTDGGEGVGKGGGEVVGGGGGEGVGGECGGGEGVGKGGGGGGGGGWAESPGTGREHRLREAPGRSGESSPLGRCD